MVRTKFQRRGLVALSIENKHLLRHFSLYSRFFVRIPVLEVLCLAMLARPVLISKRRLKAAVFRRGQRFERSMQV